MNDSHSSAPVEHFFRHESANLIAVLTRAFGISRIDLVEDGVQAAMLEAMNAWKKGVPDNPAAWIHKVARNRVLDALRREKVHDRALAFAGLSTDASAALVDEWLDEAQVPDSLLRMMFVCCHPSLDRASQIALTLKILGGFGVHEISRGLLISTEAVKKRIQRGKKQLAGASVTADLPPADELHSRLDAVHDVLYLIFNEGYSTSHGHEPIRTDLCEEAARLCHLLCEHEDLSTATTRALLSLMLFHGARLDARTDSDGNHVLLEDQDRSLWDRGLIRMAQCWLERSRCENVSRFHIEAAISLQHCIAYSVESTDWSAIVRLYDRLIAAHHSPLYVLNRAIALGQAGETAAALRELESIRDCREMSDYFLIDCAFARIHELDGNKTAAIDCYLAALSRTTADHEMALLKRKISALQ